MRSLAPAYLSALYILLMLSACAPKPAPAPAPPAPPPNVFALLPEPDGSASGITVRNQAGAQQLDQPYQAVRVARNDTAPGTPVVLSAADVRQLFGSAIDSLPEPELAFVLNFDEDKQELNPASMAKIPEILNAIRTRRSTSITVIGHTDTVATPDYNYKLGMRRAQNVAAILRNHGVPDSDLFWSSHGDADLLVKTERGKANADNRRVEVIVR